MKLVMDVDWTRIEFDQADAYLEEPLAKIFHTTLGVRKEGFQFSPAYKSHKWDGYIDFYDKKERRFPTGLANQVDTILGDLQNTHNFTYEFVDDRPDAWMKLSELPAQIDLKDESIGSITLRDYQYDAVKSIIEHQTGILNISTNGGKCLLASTKVLTNRGLKELGTLFTEVGETLDTEERVVPYTGAFRLVNKDGRLESPSHLTINGARKVLEVTTDKGYRETVTENHPLRVVAPSGKHIWVEAQNLAIGDWVVSRRNDNVFGDNTLPTEDAIALGALTADGYYGTVHQVTFTNNEKPLLDLMTRFFHRSGLAVKLDPNGTSQNSYILRGTGTVKARFYEMQGITNGVAKDKRVPSAILEADRETQLAFLSGYLECEMSIEVPKCSVEVTSASRELLTDIQLMLLNLGYTSNLSEKKVKGYEGNWYGRLTLGTTNSAELLKELTFVTDYRKNQVEEFNAAMATRNRNPKGQTVPFGKALVQLYKDTYPNPPKGMKTKFDFPRTISIVRLRELIAEFPDGLPEYKTMLTDLLDPSYVYSQVTDVTDQGYQPTYDVCMPETHSFIANGIVNHNTEIASGIIQQLLPRLQKGERIAFFTSSSAIFNQSADRISERLGIPVGKYGNGKKDFKQVTVVMIPTVAKALTLDPEKGLKLTAKERQLKRIAKEIAPKFSSGLNQRMLLKNFLSNFPIKTGTDKELVTFLEDEVLYACGTDKQVKMKFNSYAAQYQKLLETKNKDAFKKKKVVTDFLDTVAVAIGDEIHHAVSDTWYNTLLSCPNAQYKVGLTGSIDKKDDLVVQRLMAIFGQITNRISNEYLIDEGFSAKPKMVISPVTQVVLNGYQANIENTKDFMKAYESGIVSNQYRNTLVAKITELCYNKGEGVLIIVNRIEHGENIGALLDILNIPFEFVTGDLDISVREDTFADMKRGNLKVMIATSLIDEGVDISGINSLIMAAGGKSLRQVLQRVGRVLRKKKTGANTATIYDFDDRTNKHLYNHSQQRMGIYQGENFEMVILG